MTSPPLLDADARRALAEVYAFLVALGRSGAAGPTGTGGETQRGADGGGDGAERAQDSAAGTFPQGGRV